MFTFPLTNPSRSPVPPGRRARRPPFAQGPRCKPRTGMGRKVRARAKDGAWWTSLSRQEPVRAVAALLVLAIVAQVVAADGVEDIDRCYDIATPVPCGANARWVSGGVVSDISYSDLQELDTQYADKLGGYEGFSIDTTYTRIAFALYYDHPTGDPPPGAPASPSGTARCVISQAWDMTTSYPSAPQCALNGPCTDNAVCRTLSEGTLVGGGDAPISFQLDITADDLFYALPLGDVQGGSMPFERMQHTRGKRAQDPNDDEEDDHVCSFYGDADYDLGMSEGQLAPKDGYDDDDADGRGIPMFLDDDNDNVPNELGGQDNALTHCYGDDPYGQVMAVVTHMYDPNSDTDLSWTCRHNNPGVCTGSDNQATRVLNFQTAFGPSTGFTPSELYTILDNDIIEADAAWSTSWPCTPSAVTGCAYGPFAEDWDVHPTGDDEDDTGPVGNGDDDDVATNNWNDIARAYNIRVFLQESYLTGEWAQKRTGAPSLGKSLYTTLTRSQTVAPGGLMKKTQSANNEFYAAPTITYCKPGVDGRLGGRRYFQHDITPGCNVYTPGSLSDNEFRPIWAVAGGFTRTDASPASVSGQFLLQNSEANGATEAVTIDHDVPGEATFGAGASFTLLQGAYQAVPSADVDGAYAVVVCESDPNVSFRDPVMAIDPWRELEDGGRGSTLMQQGLAMPGDQAGEQAVYTLNEVDYLALSNSCNSEGPVSDQDTAWDGSVPSVGYTGGGCTGRIFRRLSNVQYRKQRPRVGGRRCGIWYRSDPALGAGCLLVPAL